MKRLHLQIRGVVQGVGFRPFVYNLARKLNLKGFVTNTSKGVTLEIEGEKIEEFLETLKREPPPLSKIYSIEIKELPFVEYDDFSIIESIDDTGFTHVSEDVSICEDCLRELFSREDRRYLYPFINCTNCGPRYTITLKVPYDRPNTTMDVFKMCPECLKEYKDPTNRRFHAQPNACPVCGPQVKLFIKTSDGVEEVRNDAISTAIELIKNGKILAIRGLGGFHLCCDGKNEASIETLRRRKKRSNKPFALMSPKIELMEKFCYVFDAERNILLSPMRPIVLLKKRPDCSLPEKLAPLNSYLGFMLPYTPLHYLLFYYPSSSDKENFIPHFEVLVMTSGNISEEPIIIKNEEAFEKLKDVADAFLIHNREIFMRVDDSVVRELEGDIYFIRRARGFVPKAIPLQEELPEVMGAGADLKNTFTLIKVDSLIVSQHIGDMENMETLEFYEEVFKNLKSVYRIEPMAIGCDLHPMYFSTEWAKNYAEEKGIPLFYLQHHYSHISSLMAEYGLDELFGIAFDGTGFGLDNTIWGSEFLYCHINGFERLATLKGIPLIGGEKSIKECSRIALSLLEETFGEDISLIKRLPPGKVLEEEKIRQLLKIKKVASFSPLSSGMGRLFDGSSSLIGVCHFNTFEAEAAIALESLIDERWFFTEKDCYPFELITSSMERVVIDYRPMVEKVIEEVLCTKKGSERESLSQIAWKFHNTIVKMILEVTDFLRARIGFDKVGLSGGVFQNAYLIRESIKALRKMGILPLYHKFLPSNDACISVGQAYIVGKRLKAQGI